MQEGLAVLAELLVGGLSRPRLRTLAARVVAAKAVEDDATFVDTFRLLTRDLGVGPRAAFRVALRVHRGGGLTKDAIYLRGLLRVLELVRITADLAPLYVGKIGLHHLPFVEELRYRKVLCTDTLTPAYLGTDLAAHLLGRIRSGAALADLIDERGRLL